MTDYFEKISALKDFIVKVDFLLENLIADCTGFYVPEAEFRQFKREINIFFDQNFPPDYGLVNEFKEIVTESKKHKMLYARVILKDILNDLSGDSENLRN